ncbi:hypothetical protein Bpfe_026256, partial [Biomphalaria pfeifferi]
TGRRLLLHKLCCCTDWEILRFVLCRFLSVVACNWFLGKWGYMILAEGHCYRC